ncbi:hypothetical protein A8C32_01815 [Flavivirga aquatica]|uniref:Uncharacterized protein n=1 Tax=Flavivirga aquatica TaxID=1849968 RepID=A0A1E5TA07_9FLAO|nr:hypothetical protein [Flavivirga aquatica]OEK08225.1 hypothetical protein A8C32_01815 [Flavivirga aquatica]
MSVTAKHSEKANEEEFINDKKSVVPNKKVIGNKKTIVISHYDDNQPVSLSLPESLCFNEELNEAEEPQEKQSVNVSYQSSVYNDGIEDAVILSEPPYTQAKNLEPYSDANSYFEIEHEALQENNNKPKKELTTKSLNIPFQEHKHEESITLQEVQNNESQPIEIPQLSEEEKLADKKFEDDLRSILAQKQTNDRQREQGNPAEAEKNKDHGIADPSDEAFKKKLNERHAIFDQIAQSMQMANTYDFGAIAMSKKLDSLEEETNEDFTQKIQDLLEEDKKKDKPSYAGKKEDEDKVLTEDFLEDINKLNELSAVQSKKKEHFTEDAIILEDYSIPENKDVNKTNSPVKKVNLSKQSSFDSTISIKHRYLKSRVFSVTDGTVAVTIDSNWIPEDCSKHTHLNVTLTQDIDWEVDSEKATKKFKIGTADTQTWSGLPSGNYYLTFFFINNTNPHCELRGTVKVIT